MTSSKENTNSFNKVYTSQLINAKLAEYIKQNGMEHVEELGGISSVREMIEIDYELEKEERQVIDFDIRRKAIADSYKITTPHLYASGFFAELWA